jgi:hypothetical protein
MFLAPNGKIYLTASTGGCQHIHELNYPDSAGFSCNLQQHAIFLNAWHFNAVPNYPNYYLGADTTSICDSLTSVKEYWDQVQNFKVLPNPVSNGHFSISYLLPQNKSGIFDLYDSNGRIIYSQKLPQWSTLQYLEIPELKDGLFYCTISSGNSRMTQKLVVIKNN